MLKRKHGADGAGNAGPPQESQIWVEKYRPKTLDQVASQDHAVDVLKRTLLHANMPHMLFYGPPGTGKTSTILALAKDLFGPEMMKGRVLELNASDERGISIVREKVKNFAKAAVTSDRSAGTSGHPCPPYKIIILDEADSMTQDAQAALRRTMETYSRITRFCLICNYVTRIIEPLASRCSKFRFRPLGQVDARARIAHICEQEKLRCEDGAIDTLVDCAEGDLRKAITYLQSAAKLVTPPPDGQLQFKRSKGTEAAGGEVNAEDDGAANGEDSKMLDLSAGSAGQAVTITKASIVEVAGVIEPGVVERLLEVCMDSKLKFDAVESAVRRDVVRQGYSASQVVAQLHDAVVASERISARHKNAILIHMSEVDKKLNDGASEHLQLFDLVCQTRAILSTA